jgi:DNA (cytosine-5)-methyltransferase 1
MAWKPLGWEAVAFSEIEPFPSAVLAHHYPHVPNWGDMTKYESWPHEPIDLLCGGTPCQSFSVAGLRKGLDDPRGNLMLTFGAIAAKYRPRWLVWENVPGVLSSNGGWDFGAFLGMLGQLGYGFAYRVLDAQYFGVAQRRRRVFVVGCLGDWRAAAAVLFERHSLQGHPAPSRKAGKDVTATLTGGASSGGHGRATSADGAASGIIQPFSTANTLTARMHKGMNSDVNEGQTPVIAFLASQDPDITGDIAHPLGAQTNGMTNGVLSFDLAQITSEANRSRAEPGLPVSTISKGSDMHVAFQSSQSGVRIGDAHATLDANNGSRRHNGVIAGMQVRRLTPEECEKLQGFTPGYTAIPWRKKPASECPDGPRYKALGNSWAVPCARWIGERIEAYLSAMSGAETEPAERIA